MITRTLACNVNDDKPGVAPFDIYLGPDGNFAISSDIDAVLEYCAQAASTILGEVFLNTKIGIPFKQTVWNGVPNIPAYESALRQAFIGVNGGGFVQEVVSLTTTLDENTLTYDAVIKTIYGTENISGIING